jgi:Ca2+-binding EF-hand superfamily protein
MNSIIKNTQLMNASDMSKEKIEELRKKFVMDYCSYIGWDPNNLTEEQLEKIKENKQYKNPSLILS